MQFEWDEEKNQTNIRQHGFDFNDVSSAFDAPMITNLDLRQEYTEERWIGIGLLQGRVVVIVFTEPYEDTIRVISLRKALKQERQYYEQFLQNRLGKN